MRSAHANEEDLKICHICFYKTSSNQNLKTHIEAKHEKVRNFECPQCDLKFYAKATMVHHIKGKYLTNSSDDFTNLFPRIFLSLSCWKRKQNSYFFFLVCQLKKMAKFEEILNSKIGIKILYQFFSFSGSFRHKSLQMWAVWNVLQLEWPVDSAHSFGSWREKVVLRILWKWIS